MLLCGRTFLVATFRLVFFPHIWERVECAHEQLLAKDPFFPEF